MNTKEVKAMILLGNAQVLRNYGLDNTEVLKQVDDLIDEIEGTARKLTPETCKSKA